MRLYEETIPARLTRVVLATAGISIFEFALLADDLAATTPANDLDELWEQI